MSCPEKSVLENSSVPLVSPVSRDESFERLLLAADVEYTQCELHAQEMMINTVACVHCQVLVCPLCLCNKHLGHEVISLVKLRECKSLRSKLDDDLNQLQVLQERLKNQLQHRKEMQAAIEESSKELIEKLDKSFDRLLAIISAKREEHHRQVLVFTERQLEAVRDDVAALEQRYTSSTRMIQKVVGFSSSRMGDMLTESQALPEQLKVTLKECQLLKTIDSYDAFLPGKKFAKVIPSLEALCNICQTMHPEATKVIWSKVPPEKKRQLETQSGNHKPSESGDADVSKRKRGRPSVSTPKRPRGEKSMEVAKPAVNGVDSVPETSASSGQ